MQFDISAMSAIGTRMRQEDGIAYRVLPDEKTAIIVLADGVGGSGNGHIASECVVNTALHSVLEGVADVQTNTKAAPNLLKKALTDANEHLHQLKTTHPGTGAMSATFIAVLLLGDRLYWVSIGDSLLFLKGANGLKKINKEHSVAETLGVLEGQGKMRSGQIKYIAQSGALTAALDGKAVGQMDCPETPLRLRKGDKILIASDGLSTLTTDEIDAILSDRAKETAIETSTTLLQAVDAANASNQDNTTLAVLRAF